MIKDKLKMLAQELENLINESIPELEENKRNILIDLLVFWLVNIRKLKIDTLIPSIIHPFNNGKSGAIVFLFEFHIQNTNSHQKWVFKFDKESKIHKEIENNSYLHTIEYSDIIPEYESINHSIEGFSLLPFKNIGSNTLQKIITIDSLNNIVIKNMDLNLIDSTNLKSIAGLLNESLERIFTVLFQIYEKGIINQTGSIPMNQMFESILPPKLKLDIDQITPQEKEDKNYSIDFDKKDTIKIKNLKLYEIEKEENFYNLKFQLIDDEYNFRIDGNIPLDKFSNPENEKLYQIKGKIIFKRDNFYDNEFHKLQLKEPNPDDFIHPFYKLSDLLKKPSNFFKTNFLHYDLNPTNIILCKLDNDEYKSYLIDFFESKKSGSIFFDVARLEIQATLNFYTYYWKLKFFPDSTIHSISDIPPEKLSELDLEIQKEMKSLQTKLSFYKPQEEKEFGILDYLYSILYNLRKRSSDYLKNKIGHDYFKTYKWYENYLYTLAFFSVSYFKYTKEDDSWLKKRIAYYIAGNLFYLAKNNDESFLRDIHFSESIPNTNSDNNKSIPSANKNLPIQRIDIQKSFKEYYKKHFSHIESIWGDNKFPIEDIFINLSIIKEEDVNKEEYNSFKNNNVTEEKLLEQSFRENRLSGYERIHNLTEVVDYETIPNTAKRSLILGKAGVGKSTFCRYISYRWSVENLWKNKFTCIVYIELRAWKNANKELDEYLSETYFKSSLIVPLDHYPENTLWLIDGLDESDKEFKEKVLKITSNFSHCFFVSRHHGIRKNEFQGNDFNTLDEVFEITGFTDENIEEYINKFFKEGEKGNLLFEYLKKNKDLFGISHTPIILEIICTLWKDDHLNFDDSLTLTDLYTKIINNTYLRNLTKINNSEYNPDNINFETIKENFFFLLGEISYKSLLKNSPFISGEIIVEALKERNNQKEFQYPIFQNLEIFLEPGFLKGDSEKKEKIKKEYQFNHLTFQEYFAGYYLSKLDKETLIEKFIESKLLKQFEIVYWFATGLYCKTPQTSKDFFEYLWKEPIDLIGSYNLQLILGCTGQLKTLDKEIQSKLEREVDRLLIYERKTKNVIITGTLSISYKYLIYKYAERFWKNIEYEENYYNYSRESFKLLRAHPESSKRLGKCFNVVDGLSVRFLRRLNIPNNTINNTILLSLIDEDLSNRLEAFKALWGLSQIDSNIKKGLIVSLKDEDAKARLYASQALIRFGFIDLEIINTLLHLLKENNIDIKIEAIQLLEKSTLKDLRIIKELYNNFNNEENKIKFYSAKALITLGEKDLNLIDYLFLSLKSKGIESFYAAITLGNLGKYNSNIIKRLLLSLKNENRKLRINAIHALEIAKKLELTVIEELCFSQKDEDELVKKYTLQIISKLIKVNPQIINILLKALKDNSKKVRSKAIEVLINSDIMVEKTTWDEIKENTFGNKRLIFIEKYLLKKVGIKESLVNFFKFLIEKKVNITSDIFKKELREILTISPYSLYQTKIKEFKFPSLINAYIHYPSKKLLKLIYHKALQEKIPIFVKEGKVYIPQISKGPIFWEEKVNPKDLKSIENKFIRFISKYKPGGFFENLWIKLFKRVM